MFKSLKFKLLSFFLIINIFILSGFSIFIYITAKKGVSDTTDNMMQIISMDAVSDLRGKTYIDAKKTSEELIKEFEITPLVIKIIYYDKKTSTIINQTTSSAQHQELFDIPLNVMGYLHSIYYFNKGAYRVSSMQLFEDDDIKIIFQLATKKIIKSPYLEHLFMNLIIGIPIILIILLFVVNFLINRTLLPVKNVINSVKSMEVSNLSQRIDSKNIPTEIEDLVKTFNKLLDRLEESFSSVASFSSNASHELKTPLTVIRGEIEVALRQNRTESEYKLILEELLQETTQVQEIIEQLFFITQKDSSEYLNNHKDIYFDEIILDAISQNQKFADQKSIHLNVKNIIPITINANETLVKVAIGNILRNAIIYSENSAIVDIYMKEDTDNYFLYIQDFGCGISKKDIPFIFERFYRVDKVRSRKNSGTGLGLAIVKMILNMHHYMITIESIVDKGTTVVIKIPKIMNKNS